MIDIACLITSRGTPEKHDDTGSLWAADTREPDPAYLQAKHDAEAHMRTYGVEWREAS